jgi:pyruvate,water dikinase
MVLRLDAGVADPSVVGGKGAGLARLVTMGHGVPAGFIITAHAFHAAMEAMGLEASFARLEEKLVAGGDALGVAEAIRDGLGRGRIPQGMMREALEEVRALRLFERYGAGVIVRSSATTEDSAANSFAGIFESLRAGRVEDLEAALRQVWAAGFSERAMSYLQRRGILAPPGIAAVVQAFIDPERSGVMYSRFAGPDGSRRILVEHVAGPCEPLVKGEVTPARLWLDPDLTAADGPGDGLTAAQVAALKRLARELEEAFGAPQDVEWLTRGSRVIVVQARPITS